MKKLVLILILIASFGSCKSSKGYKRKSKTSTKIVTKKSTTNKKNNAITSSKVKTYSSKNTSSKPKSKAQNIIEYAEEFKGVRYKWGGTTKAGMDCSGLIFESFKAYDVTLPRISRDMAKRGNKVSLKDVHKGDLLFFKTGNRRNAINHVGLIVSIRNNNIEFIHATSSKGVMTSWLNETYWHKAFYEARRVL
jgi:cell wall-associated NlpC family hydrolase